jgi:hypothetical protein
MRKKANELTRPPLRAKTRLSPHKAAASKEANRTLGRTVSL